MGDPEEGLTYAEAGVDIDEGEHAVDLIRPLVAATHREGVVGGIGGFGGLFAVPTDRYREPVLVASTDGVGTKIEIARAVNKFDTVGIDLVAMCVDDLVCHGAEPLFFLDYVAVDRLDAQQIRDIVAGVAEGCCQAGAALLGGEMAEHPGTMIPGSFDLAGFAIGVVERSRVLDGSAVKAGDVLIGLASPGLRSNGFSLARAVIKRAGLDLNAPAWPGAQRSLAEELLVPSIIYAPSILKLINAADVHGVVHVTGGGIPGNVPRILNGVDAVVDRSTWTVPRIFDELAWHGGIDDAEMLRVFNLGLGMIAVVAKHDADTAIEVLENAVVVGEIVEGEGTVRLVG